jgi:excisionase family DNA binding protein
MSNERFLTLADVADILNISASQTYALVKSRELEAIQIGGRGQWRVERDKLESYIARMYDRARDLVTTEPVASPERAASPARPQADHAQPAPRRTAATAENVIS